MALGAAIKQMFKDHFEQKTKSWLLIEFCGTQSLNKELCWSTPNPIASEPFMILSLLHELVNIL
jgi:hypothetical protein